MKKSQPKNDMVLIIKIGDTIPLRDYRLKYLGQNNWERSYVIDGQVLGIEHCSTDEIERQFPFLQLILAND